VTSHTTPPRVRLGGHLPALEWPVTAGTLHQVRGGLDQGRALAARIRVAAGFTQLGCDTRDVHVREAKLALSSVDIASLQRGTQLVGVRARECLGQALALFSGARIFQQCLANLVVIHARRLSRGR
jgi:hypothetical protein